MATENLTQEEIIAKLTAERDAYKLEATGGKDLDALKKAEDSFNKFDKKIAEITTSPAVVQLGTTEKRNNDIIIKFAMNALKITSSK